MSETIDTTKDNTEDSSRQTPLSTFSGIFTHQSLIYMLIFLGTYSVVYFVLGVFYGGSAENPGSLRIVRILDVMILLFVVIYVVMMYANKTMSEFSTSLSGSLSDFKIFAENPYSIFTVLTFLLALYMVVYAVKIPMTAETKPVSIMVVETGSLLLFVGLLILDFFKYVLGIDLLNFTLDWIIGELTPGSTPSSTLSPNFAPRSTCPSLPTPPTEPPGEVFNIRNNLYTYDEAREVCSIYGAKLATYEQIEKSYNEGGEWCNYGWSEGQMALFPTQLSTWKKMQSTDGSCPPKKVNNACGRPGINGGIIKNPKIRYGANCYGKKPPPSDSDKAMMEANVEIKVTESPADAALKAKMNVWKQNADKFLSVNSFNKKQWSNDE